MLKWLGYGAGAAAYYVGTNWDVLLDRLYDLVVEYDNWRLYSGRARRPILLWHERLVSGVTWEIVAEPKSDNQDKKNKGGMVVYLRNSNSGSKEEIGRVAFERKNSLDPDKTFEEKVDEYIDAAKKTVETMNELLAGAGTLS